MAATAVVSRVLSALAVLTAPLLAQAPQAEPQWTPLFDGKTLAGWTESGGRYDGDADWSVEDGAIVGRQSKTGQGGLLYTTKPYTEFELELETMISYPFDSGIFVRMAPGGKGAQLTLDYRSDGEVGAIYSDGFLVHNEAGKAKFKKDQWNALKVRVTGADLRLEAWLNGEPLVDYQLPSGTPGYAPTGLIGVQVHGDRNDPPETAARFRNVRIKDLAPTPSDMFVTDDKGFLAATPWGVANGWVSLFDGQSLAGWEEADGQGGFEATNGVLRLMTKGGAQSIRTRDDWKDFEFQLDFAMARGTNSGVFLRGDRKGGDPAWSGCEIQILDDHHWEADQKYTLKPWQFTGSLYGSAAPATKALKPHGEWNRMSIRMKGSTVRTLLNGAELYSVDTTKLEVPQGQKPFAERAGTGFIGIQRHAPEGLQVDSYLQVRNIWARRL